MAMDVRVRFTKSVIVDSFISLLAEQPLEKISVSAICEKAEISRATFYRYYDNPFDLYDKVHDAFFAAMRLVVSEQVELSRSQNVFYNVFVGLLSFLQENKVTLAAFRANGNYHVFDESIFDYTYDVLSSVPELGQLALPETAYQYLRIYTWKGSAEIVRTWIAGGMKEPPEEITEFLMCCARGIHEEVDKHYIE